MKTFHHWLLTRHRKALLAFNLIEVTLSVAIIGVAVAVLLGMFPVGLKASRDAANYTMASTIANRVLSTLQAGGMGTFSQISLREFGTLAGAGTIVYYQSGTGSLLPAKTFVFNAVNPTLTPGGTLQPFIIFFDEQGRSTSNTGTGTGTLPDMLGKTPALARRPYYRVEFTITNNSDLVPGTNVATVLLNVRWPCVGSVLAVQSGNVNFGSYSGWRPRRENQLGSITTDSMFTDKTATYFGIIIQNNK